MIMIQAAMQIALPTTSPNATNAARSTADLGMRVNVSAIGRDLVRAARVRNAPLQLRFTSHLHDVAVG
jgi:hypothetical protein